MTQQDGDRNKNNTQTGDTAEQPEPEFWQHYSPHHEFSLSTASSIGVCCLAAGLVALFTILASMSRHDPARKPAEMDAVEIAGGGGTDGLGPRGDGPDAQGNENRGENVVQPQQAKANDVKPSQPTEKLNTEIPNPVIKVETPTVKEDDTGEAVFGQLETVARKQVEEAMKPPPSKGPSGKKGVVNPGKGGGTGGGEGTGSGIKKGPGGGTGETGVVRTLKQRREMRWRIDFSGTGQQHLEKLRALGVTLAVPMGQPGIFRVMDLTGPRPTSKIANLSQEQNKVKWFNTSRQSLTELAQVLQLRPVPPFVVIFLPETMEQEMIRLEHDYKGLEEHQIALTEFEIQQRNDGRFGPVVVRQQPR